MKKNIDVEALLSKLPYPPRALSSTERQWFPQDDPTIEALEDYSRDIDGPFASYSRRILSAWGRDSVLRSLLPALDFIQLDGEDYSAQVEELVDCFCSLGEPALEPLLERLNTENLVGSGITSYRTTIEILRIFAEQYPSFHETICLSFDELLKDFRQLHPSINATLIQALDRLGAADPSVVTDCFAHRLVDLSLISWEDLKIDSLRDKIEPLPKCAFRDEPFDFQRYKKIVSQLGTNYSAEEIRCMIVGTLFVDKFSAYDELFEHLFAMPTSDISGFVSLGHQDMIYRETRKLRDSLLPFRRIVYPLDRFPARDVQDEALDCSQRAQAFVAGVEISGVPVEKMKSDFIKRFLAKSQELQLIFFERPSVEEIKQTIQSLRAYWNNSYLGFAREALSLQTSL